MKPFYKTTVPAMEAAMAAQREAEASRRIALEAARNARGAAISDRPVVVFKEAP